MPEKMLTLRELSDHLGVGEDKVIALVDEGVIIAYRIGGELLRFRKDQIDAIRSEIETRLKEAGKQEVSESRKKARERLKALSEGEIVDTPQDRIADFLYFNDFYILSGALIIILVLVIFLG
jgi:excisionase family DNA binding protein